MQILVTGGAGFIGSHLVDRLVQVNHSVTVIDNLSTGDLRNLQTSIGNVDFIQGDILDENLVRESVRKSDIVFHMAAALGVKNIVENPIESLKSNYNGSENVLLACTEFSKRVFISSTSEIYGKNPNQPLSETFDRVVGPPQKLRWTYSDAKALEESLAFALYQKQNLPVTTLRFFNTVGPRQTAAYGMVIPNFVKAAIKGQPLEVHGNGMQSRVFCHVSDVIDALILLMDKPETIGEVYNIGGLGEISINELANTVLDMTKSASKIKHIPYSEVYNSNFEDMQRRVPDITKITSTISWTPQRSLKQIIEEVISQFN